ncbi:MAG: LemA family protein [Candidatus Gastranaerophilaceae bacterium]
MIWTIFVAILLIILYLVKLARDLEVNKDNVLRGLASVDAILIKKNLLLLDIISYAKEFMDKEKVLIDEILALRQDINKVKPKIENAEQRYSMQKKLDKKLEYLLSAMDKYKDQKNNAGLQSILKKFAMHEQALDEKLKFYNNAVDSLNNSINSFPSSIFAQINKVKAPPPKYDR